MSQLIHLPSHTVAVYMQGDTNAEKLALVLPGKLDTKDYPHMRSHVDFLAKKGYLALSFDPPGTWESPGDIDLYTMTNYLTAIDELITYHGNKPTIVLGHSRGGGIATIAGTTNPFITHFISIMGSAYPSEHWTTIDDKTSQRDVPFTNPVEYRTFKTSHVFVEPKDAVDMSKKFTVCTKPKMFILGTKDDMVTPEEVSQYYELFGHPKELYELQYGHDYRRSPKHIEEVNVCIEKFLEKYNI